MLTIHRAERSTTLVRELATILTVPLSDPFTPEIVAVPAKGVERWLSQQLSTFLGAGTSNDGISANIDFPSPNQLVERAVNAVDGHADRDDPWIPERLLWTLTEVIDNCLGEPWASVLSAHLGHEQAHESGRRYATAAHVAALFDTYGIQRPTMIAEWALGHNSDGAGSLLDDDLRWQPEVWRRLRQRIGSPSPAERLEATCARLRREPDLLDFPVRLSLFGPTRLASMHLSILAAISTNRDVHLWITHPSKVLWDKSSAAPPQRHRRDAAHDRLVDGGSPLLASLGRDVREMQSTLSLLGAVDIYHPGPAQALSLLGRIQSDIGADRTPEPTAHLDGSLTVHACHGPSRQVEVLRESLLHLFENDKTLEPRDIVVMCPDIDTYAPLIRASFGQGDSVHPGHRLRVRLADRGLHQTNPVLAVVDTFLALADGRVTATQVLDLAGTTPVRCRFDFGDDDIARLREWTVESGSRWGVARRQRVEYGLADFPQNTFVTGMDRVLLGVAADESENGWLDLALPLDDVDSNDIDLVGRFSEYLDRLAVTLRDLHGPRSPQSWIDVILRGVDLLTATSPMDDWQIGQTRTELSRAIFGSEALDDVHLELPDIRTMLAKLLKGRPTRANFRTGELTMCTMVPMRSVPHRIVILLGLDDDVFPRAGTVDGDDVLLRDPLVGERDVRTEDRQLLLDAVLAAADKLVIIYTGADPITGSIRPPAVPLGELLDTVELSLTPSSSDTASDVVVRHPLQPFDPENFTRGEPFSFDAAAFDGAVAHQQVLAPESGFLARSLPPLPPGDVNLVDLMSFLADPTGAFLRQRLGVRIPEPDEGVRDSMDVVLEPLSAWALGERMLAARLGGMSRADFRATEWRRGTLPPFALGSTSIDDIERNVEALLGSCQELYRAVRRTIDVSVDLGDGRRLFGTVTDVFGDVMTRTSYSRLAPNHRLRAWAALLACAASGDDAPARAVVTGRGRGSRPIRSVLTVPPDTGAVLRSLVDLRDRGLNQPVPIASGASATYAHRIRTGFTRAESIDAARAEWDSRFGDGQDRHIAYVYGRAPDFDVFAGQLSEPDEVSWAGEEMRFGAMAQRLWTPLLSAEEIDQS